MTEIIEKKFNFAEKRKILNDILKDLLVSIDPEDEVPKHPTVDTALNYLAIVCEFDQKRTIHKIWYSFRCFNCDKRQVERAMYILLSHHQHDWDHLAQGIRDNIKGSFAQNNLYNSVFSAILEYALIKYIEVQKEQNEPFKKQKLANVPF